MISLAIEREMRTIVVQFEIKPKCLDVNNKDDNISSNVNHDASTSQKFRHKG